MYYLVIREYRMNDQQQVAQLVKQAYSSLIKPTFISALTREITFQMIVMMAAIMFIFLGLPVAICMLSIPIIVILIYVSIYASYTMKAYELMQGKCPLQCWVVDSYQPFFMTASPQTVSYRLMTEEKLIDEEIQVGNLKRQIIGTISVCNFHMVEEIAWLYRLAVDENHKGVGYALISTVKNWATQQRYKNIAVTMSEFQDTARQLFINSGFQMKQMYHKRILGSLVALLMYQFDCDLTRSYYQ